MKKFRWQWIPLIIGVAVGVIYFFSFRDMSPKDQSKIKKIFSDAEYLSSQDSSSFSMSGKDVCTEAINTAITNGWNKAEGGMFEQIDDGGSKIYHFSKNGISKKIDLFCSYNMTAGEFSGASITIK